MFIQFEDSLRLVVSSANLYEIDWAQLGQVIWFQDFPRNLEGTPQTNDALEILIDFLGTCVDQDSKEMLQELSKAQYTGFECPENVEDITLNEFVRGGLKLEDYDFNSCAVKFVSSVNGQIPSTEKEKYGLFRFADLIKQNGLEIKESAEIVYQCTSYGNLSRGYLDKFVDTLSGTLSESGESNPDLTSRANLKLIYPTQEYVDRIKAKNGKIFPFDP